MFHRILVALERSERAIPILEEAIALARATGASMKLVHVFNGFEEGYANPVYPGLDGLYAPIHDEVMKAYFEHWEAGQRVALEWLQTLASRVEQAGVPVELAEQMGDPGSQICEMAQQWEADLILVGRRGRRGITELLLGSVSNYVLHHAPCSVLTVQGCTVQNPADQTSNDHNDQNYTTSASSTAKLQTSPNHSAVV
ncbi:MAG: universal stress protein [Synechococcales bacterium]|nr:universal stress protein [Synechococcales bacterium]